MKILVLSPYPERITPAIRSTGDEAVATSERLDVDSVLCAGFDLIVSYGYRYILREPLLGAFSRHIVNLHVSYLPWNGGADPNFWSFFDETPKGVTIHLIDAGIDTGDIIAQEPITFSDDETLKTSYEKLQRAMEGLFARIWPTLREGTIHAEPQRGKGSTHRAKDKEPFMRLLPLGWDTPVSEVTRLGRAHRA